MQYFTKKLSKLSIDSNVLSEIEKECSIKHGFLNIQADKLSENLSIPIQVFEICKDIDWNCDILSARSDLTIEFLFTSKNIKWNWKVLTENPIFSLQEIQGSMGLPWDKATVYNRSIDDPNSGIQMQVKNNFWSFVLDNARLPWDWDELSSRDDVTEEIISQKPTLPWNFRVLYGSNKISLSFYRTHSIKRHGRVGKPIVPWKFLLKTPQIHKFINWTQICSDGKISKWYGKHIEWEDLSWYLELYRDTIPWDWTVISQRSDLDWEFLINKPGLPWDWSQVSRSPAIPFHVIVDHTMKPWDWISVASRRDIDLTFIKDTMNTVNISTWKSTWNWNILSWNVSVTWKFISEHPDYPWDWKVLSSKRNAPVDFILSHLDIGWHWPAVFSLPVTMDLIDSNVKIKFDYKVISSATYLTWKFVSKHLDKPWDWYLVSSNISDIPVLFILHNPSYNWNYNELSRNVNLDTILTIDTFPDACKPWDWTVLSERCTIDQVVSGTTRPWDWSVLTRRFSDCTKSKYPLLPWIDV